MNYAGVGLRAVATIIDGLVLGVIGYLIAVLTGETTDDGFQLEGVSALLWFLVAMGYYVVLEARLGWTLGKRLIGLQVVRLDGAALDWQASIIRNLLRIIDGLPFLYLVGAILVWTSDKKQRLGDRIAGTAVVRSGR